MSSSGFYSFSNVIATIRLVVCSSKADRCVPMLSAVRNSDSGIIVIAASFNFFQYISMQII